MDVLIVAYAPRVYLSGVKVKVYLLFYLNYYYFVIKSIHSLYFINNAVVYKTLLAWESGGGLVYRVFIVVSLRLSAADACAWFSAVMGMPP